MRWELPTIRESAINSSSTKRRTKALDKLVQQYSKKKLALLEFTQYAKQLNKVKFKEKTTGTTYANSKKIAHRMKKTNDSIKKINKRLEKAEKKENKLSYEITKQFKKVNKWIGKVEAEFDKVKSKYHLV